MIHFFSEETEFSPDAKASLRKWLKEAVINEGKKPGELNFIFCGDEYLLTINQRYLGHSTYTDIITFDNQPKTGHVGGDIFISIDRVRENAAKYQTDSTEELHRVLIHGVLHLLGFKDKLPEDKKLMTEKENEYLELWRRISASGPR